MRRRPQLGDTVGPSLTRCGARHFWSDLRSERGLVVVEATFIYPVVFAVLVLLLYVGDMYYQRAWVESAAMNYSLDGAAEIASGSLKGISVDKTTGRGLLEIGDVKNDPYRFILNGGTDTGGVEGIITTAESAIKREINDGSASFFGLAPKVKSLDIRYDSHVVYGEYWVDVAYGFEVPVAGFINPDGKYAVEFSSSNVTTVTSMGEFIRNIDLADDLYASTGLATEVQTGEKFGEALENAINQIKSVFN